MSRHTVRAYIGLGANVGDATATLAAAVGALGELPGIAAPRRVASLRHRTGRRHRSAGVPQRGGRARRPGGTGSRPGRAGGAGARSRRSSGGPAGRFANAGARGNWTWTCSIFGRARISVERPPAARSNDADARPGQGHEAPRRPASGGAPPPVRPRAALGPGALAGAARLGRDRRHREASAGSHRRAGRRASDRPLGRGRAEAGSRADGLDRPRSLPGRQPRRRFGITSRPKTSMNSAWSRPTLWRWTSS